MSKQEGLFASLDLTSSFNVGLYIAGIILIFSFIIVPSGININVLRSVTFYIVVLSVIAKEISRLYNIIKPSEDSDVLLLQKIGWWAIRFGYIVWTVLVIINAPMFP